MRTLLAALAAFMLLALAPSATAAAPTVDFTYTADGFEVTLTPTIAADGDSAITQVQWDFKNDGMDPDDLTINGPVDPEDPNFGDPVTYTYPAAGTWSVRLRVVDDNKPQPETTEVVEQVVVPGPNQPPVAQFSVSPLQPLIDDVVTLESFSYDPEGRPVVLRWDLDGDEIEDYVDGNTNPITTTFSSVGTKIIRLEVTDAADQTVTTTRSLTVGASQPPEDNPPVAQFSLAPVAPVVGQLVTFESFSYDPAGAPVSLAWDLDNDGDFDDGAGQTATAIFGTAGPVTVRLQVSDSVNPPVVAVRSFTVAEPEPIVQPTTPTTPTTTPAPTATPVRPSLMSPFPVIRLAGTVRPRGARISALEVRAPRGSTVTVRCVGKRCPFRMKQRTAGTGLVRFPAIRTFLPAGTVVTIAVSKENLIGKHTRFLIRADRNPRRTDTCTLPGRTRPAPCPAA